MSAASSGAALAFFRTFAQRDAGALCALCAEDVELRVPTAGLARGGEPYRGHRGLREWLRDVDRAWSELRPQPREVEVRRGVAGGGADLVLVVGRMYAWGSGRVVDQDAGWTFVVRDGRIESLRVHESAAEAVELAGRAAAAV